MQIQSADGAIVTLKLPFVALQIQSRNILYLSILPKKGPKLSQTADLIIMVLC
jgi:hypothetical protein